MADIRITRIGKHRLPSLAPGENRQWIQCRTCERVFFYDYIRFGFSRPWRELPCGHGGWMRHDDPGRANVRNITALEAVQMIHDGEGKR